MGLFPQHAEMLAASGVTPEHAAARGYVSVDTKRRLENLQITKAGRNVPGLLVPQRAADGSVWGYQYRPDQPRVNEAGKPVKYETPTGQRNGIDVPPGVGPMLADPSIPLWVTEGVKKADCAALAGLCCVALPGVWSWRGRNAHGGKTAIPDWHDIALNDREVVLAFDSDVVVKRSVRAALLELAKYLGTKGARVTFCHLPNNGDGKTGLDDYLVAGHTAEDVRRLVRPDAPEPVAPDTTMEEEEISNALEEKISTTAMVEGRPIPAGSRVLDGVRKWLGRYLLTVTDADLDLLTLWAAHTHLVTETYTTPRLLLDSPLPGSGKTTCLEHLQRLCVRPVQMAAVSSPALLTRMLEDGIRTLLIDEADRTLRPDKEGTPDLLALLNAGYKKGATRPVLVPEKGGGWVPKEMPCFAPVVMAGNSPSLPEDTRSRTIRVLLLPDINGVVEESDWELIDGDARRIGNVLAAWADQHRAEVAGVRPAMPEGIIGRFREKWQPLARVAAAAGGRWPGVVADLAVADREQVEMDREDGMVTTRPHILLLQHIAEVWPPGQHFVATTDLVADLVAEYPTVWGDASPYGKALTAQRCGRMMAQHFKVNTGRVEEPVRARGYFASALHLVWTRMGITPPIETGGTGQTGRTGREPEPDTPGSPASPGSPGFTETPEEPGQGHLALENTTQMEISTCRLVRPDGRPHSTEPMHGCWGCEQAAS